MNTQESPQKCSAANSDGQPCQAWAIRGSRPALCSVHAGHNTGGGAPVGNKNALKHGYYTRYFTEREIAGFEELTEHSLVGELVLTRTILGRLTAFVSCEETTQEEIERVVPLIFSGVGKVVQLVQNIDDSFDWDPVLDELNEEWGIEI